MNIGKRLEYIRAFFFVLKYKFALKIIAGQIFPYAAKTNNLPLKNAVNFSSSDICRIKDGEFSARCQTIHERGAANIVALAAYGVTTAALTELQVAIEDYAQSVPKPRSAITDRATVKLNIKTHFTEADTILIEQMDKLVESISKTEPDFANAYKSARVIIDPKPKKKSGTDNGENNPPA